MKKVLLVSDSHGRFSRLEKLSNKYRNQVDLLLHAGDSETSEEHLYNFISVSGNNDYYSNYPEERVFTIGNFKILLTHGHRYFYHSIEKQLVTKAKTLGCDIVCFGHTHKIVNVTIDGVRLLNPGSLNYNRDGNPLSYMLIHLSEVDIDVEIIPYK
ncbi:MAG: metallophosphoesterase [Erysipelotrichaceae bacterium]